MARQAGRAPPTHHHHAGQGPCRLCGLAQGPRWGNTELLRSEQTGEFGISILEGVEWVETAEWDRELGLIQVKHPRTQGRGLYIAASALDGGEIFTLDSVPSYVLCTDDVKTYLEERRCTNLAFLEAGEVVSE